MRKLECFYLNESKYNTLLSSQFEEADFYFSENGFTFDANGNSLYYITPN